eukprot:159708_1
MYTHITSTTMREVAIREAAIKSKDIGNPDNDIVIMPGSFEFKINIDHKINENIDSSHKNNKPNTNIASTYNTMNAILNITVPEDAALTPDKDPNNMQEQIHEKMFVHENINKKNVSINLKPIETNTHNVPVSELSHTTIDNNNKNNTLTDIISI